MDFFKKLFNKILSLIVLRNNKSFVRYLRKKGVSVGENCEFRYPTTIRIDVSRPSLVKIGNNVDMNKNFQILTHDWSSLVFRAKYHDLVNSSGAVTIGNNVYFGTNVTVLKGVSIGDNCIIGAGSVVTKNIPSNSVASGVPCKVRCSLEDYFAKRKEKGLQEAVEYVLSIVDSFGRDPYPFEMREEFIYFVNKSNADAYEKMGVPIKFQLGEAYDSWMEKHEESEFASFEDFVAYAKAQRK